MGPNRYQCWWHSDILGTRCDAYPTAQQAQDRLEEVQRRKHFIRGMVIDLQEHLTSQEGYPTRREFSEMHRRYTEQVTHV